MKIRYFFWAVFLFCGLLLNAQQESSGNRLYYYKGERTYLQIDYSRISMISEEKLNPDQVRKILAPYDFIIKNERQSYTNKGVIPVGEYSIMMRGKTVFMTELEFSKIYNEDDYFEMIQRLSKEDNITKVEPAYIFADQKLNVSNNVYIKLFKREDLDNLLELAEKYAMQILGSNEFMPLWFTLSCTKETPFSTVETANVFFESKLFEYAEPEFLYHDLLLSNDQYFSNQWGLSNIGQYCSTSGIDIVAEEAWNITTGSPDIRVAVFDQGIKMDHPDLINNIYGTGYDAETNTTPSVLRNDHGTPCAGVVGAQQNNTIGISGVAPNVKLISVSINLDWGNTPQQLANGFNWAWQNGADVISNSWGGYAPSSIIDNAITNTLAQGRNGKGTVVVFASGNEDNTNIRYPGNSNPDILVVGAIAPNGSRKSISSCDGENWWGSCYGTQLDVVAPGVFISAATYTGGYMQTFNGTSSACPHVAGVAALVLSANPNLTALQVRDIIESTAQKVGGYTYQTTSGRSNGTWYNEMGYGLVDAYAAVQAASSGGGGGCVSDFSNRTVTANTTITGCSTLTVQNVTVTGGAKLTIISGGDVTFDNFEVTPGSEFEIQ